MTLWERVYEANNEKQNYISRGLRLLNFYVSLTFHNPNLLRSYQLLYTILNT